METIIKVDNLIFNYEDAETGKVMEIIKGLNFTINKGEFVAVFGHNGSGKSTLAKLLNGILLPTDGNVYVKNLDTSNEDDLLQIRRTVGVVFQNPDNQIVANIVEDDVAFAPENLGMPSEQIRKCVDEALKTVGMYEFREQAPHLLSGGQKQRVAIAGVIAMKPECIVLDEPTAMLDPQGRKDVLDTIHKLNKEYGITIVFITHHMEEAINADRIIVLSDGEIVMDDGPEKIFTQVNQLKELGLTVPVSVELLYELNKTGNMDFSLDSLSDEACAASIYDALMRKEAK